MIQPSPLLVKPYVHIWPAGRTARVQVQLNGSTTVKNLPAQQVEPFVRLQIINAVERYVNHREQILRRHGGYLTPGKDLTLQKLRNMLRGRYRWTSAELPQIIERILPYLRGIAPGPKSRYFEHNTKLLLDLQDFCHRALDQKAAV